LAQLEGVAADDHLAGEPAALARQFAEARGEHLHEDGRDVDEDALRHSDANGVGFFRVLRGRRSEHTRRDGECRRDGEGTKHALPLSVPGDGGSVPD
jgi:hypothetical protein